MNRERCRYYVDKSLGIVTALNQYIGYLNAADVAKEALRSGKSATEVVVEKGYMTEEKLKEVLEPMRLTEPS